MYIIQYFSDAGTTLSGCFFGNWNAGTLYRGDACASHLQILALLSDSCLYFDSSGWLSTLFGPSFAVDDFSSFFSIVRAISGGGGIPWLIVGISRLVVLRWARQRKVQEASFFIQYERCACGTGVSRRCTLIGRQHAGRMETENQDLFICYCREVVTLVGLAPCRCVFSRGSCWNHSLITGRITRLLAVKVKLNYVLIREVLNQLAFSSAFWKRRIGYNQWQNFNDFFHPLWIFLVGFAFELG